MTQRAGEPSRDPSSQPREPREPPPERRVTLSFQTRLTLTLLAAAIIPLGIFGILLIATGVVDAQVGSRLLLFMFAVAVAVGILGGAAVGLDLVRPLREISTAVSRVSAGDLSLPIPVEGNDVLAQLAESHNRLASDAQRRNRQLGLILDAVESAEPRDGPAALAERAARDAEAAFGFISAELRFVDPDSVEEEERIPASRSRSAPNSVPATSGWGCCSRAFPRPRPGSGPTRRCSTCTPSRSGWPSATPSCSARSRRRTSSSAG